MDIRNTVIFVLIAVLVISLGYISFEKWKDKKSEQEINIFKQGAQYGYEQAVLDVMQRATACQPVRLFAEGGNVSIEMIGTECLKVTQQKNGSSTAGN